MKTKIHRRSSNPQRVAEESNTQPSIPLERAQPTEGAQRRAVASRDSHNSTVTTPEDDSTNRERRGDSLAPTMDTHSHAIPVKWGLLIIASFIGISLSPPSLCQQAHVSEVSFITFLVTRGALNHPPLEMDYFTNMYLAGTVIFGGGPVVIPLLREYVVETGWVSSRDFLIGLAIIQAFRGPNFNFAVYLGALTLASSPSYSFLGAFLGFVGIFLPGITLAVGFQSIWRVLRTNPFTISLLRGINATAVGLVFTAVYRLWEIGYLSSSASGGQSLGKEPFWLLVASVSYSANAWFKVPPAAAIAAGGILGLCWYGAVGR